MKFSFDVIYKNQKVKLNSNNWITIISPLNLGYDTLPIDSMQGLEIGGGPTSPYAMDMDVGEIGAGELLEAMPSPPHDNNQVAAWYDTDL